MNSQDQASNSTAPPRPSSAKRRHSLVGIVIACVALAAVGWLAWFLTHSNSGTSRPKSGFSGKGGPSMTTVGVATAERADIPVTLDALGTVFAGATVTVRPQIAGSLQKVLFHEGQMVNAGQLLATIDPRPFEMSMMQATGQLQRDQAQLDAARITLARFQTLLAQDSISRQEVDTQAALVKQLEGTVTTDRAAAGTARINLGYTRITAPTSGRIGLKVVDAGNLVSTSDANGIAVITQLSPITVEFTITQDLVPEIQGLLNAGKELQVTAFDRTRTRVLDSGVFAALDNQIDVQTGTVKAKARFTNAKGGLFPNQFVNVRLQMYTIHDAVAVPVTALRHGSNGDFVYVLDAARRTVALRPVTRGQATADKVQIASGLQAGEQAITEGADRLKDGAHVILPGDKPSLGGDTRGQGRRGQGARSVQPRAEGRQEQPQGRGQEGDGARPAGESAASAVPGAPDTARREAWRRRRQDGDQASGQNAGRNANQGASSP